MKSAGETFKMIRSIALISLVYILFSLNCEPCYSACARAEYETHGECCPMCAPGNRVYRDCTEFTSTTCVPCMGSTFLDAPNGLKECFNCMICDSVVGLKVKTSCTRTSDTVCEPLQGFYCKEENRGSCVYALEHTKCWPGQYIKQMGTSNKDAECAECEAGTFSNGTMQTCQRHTKCEDQGLIELKPGTAESDTECGDKPVAGLIVGIIFFALFVLLALGLLAYLKKKNKLPWIFKRTDSTDGTRVPQEESQAGTPSKRPPSTMRLLSLEDRASNIYPTVSQEGPVEASEEDINNPLGKVVDPADFSIAVRSVL